MAKRRRKTTLFDVMHTGQPIGLQVRTRIPAYQPTPELPVTKKLAKLFGRTGNRVDPNRPLSAAEKLEQLRRELGAERPADAAIEAPAVVEEVAPAPRVTARTERPFIAEPEHEVDEAPRATSSSFRNSARVAAEFARTAEPEPHLPQAPRRSFREVLGERWAIASPRLQSMTVHLRAIGGHSARHIGSHLQTVRELHSRYAVTAAAALGVVVLLCGSFYAGKLLFNRPAVTLASGTNTSNLADPQVRPEVLEVARDNTRSNEPIANVSGAQVETKLERNVDRNAESTPPKAGTFGGRRTDLNYVIMQSYFSQAEADATVEVLNKYGIKATVELNLPRWAMAGKNLYSVVSVDGFAKISGNADFQALMGSVNKINEREAGQTLPKKLDPMPYRLQPRP